MYEGRDSNLDKLRFEGAERRTAELAQLLGAESPTVLRVQESLQGDLLGPRPPMVLCLELHVPFACSDSEVKLWICRPVNNNCNSWLASTALVSIHCLPGAFQL